MNVADVVTIRGAVQRAKSEGLPVAECAVRRWIKCGEIPHRKAGRKILLYYPHLIKYLQCADVEDDTPASTVKVSGIRRLEV